MASIYNIPSEITPEYLVASLMADYAAQVNIKDSDLRQFSAAWGRLVQPVIDAKEPLRKEAERWESFALSYHYLSGEGFHLPLYSAPWAAAIRSFLSILGTKCPNRLQSVGPPVWSSEIRDPKVSSPLLDPSKEQVDGVRAFLAEVLAQNEDYSLELIVGKLVDEDWEAIPNDFSVASYLQEELVSHQSPSWEKRTSAPMQSLLLDTLAEGNKSEELVARYREARKASLAAQVKVLLQSLSGRRGEQWMNCTMEELAGCLHELEKPNIGSSSDPDSSRPGISLIHRKSAFPGILMEADWLPRAQYRPQPPDQLKMWIARNWVNPHAPFWMMKAPAIYALLKDTRLMVATAKLEKDRKTAEQGRILESIRYLGLRERNWTPPIIDFLPNSTWVSNGFGAERIHEMAVVSICGITMLGAAQVTREIYSRIKGAIDSALLEQLFFTR